MPRSKSYHLFAPALEIIRQSAQSQALDTPVANCSAGQRLHAENTPQSGAKSMKRTNHNTLGPIDQKRLKNGEHSAENGGDEIQVALCVETKSNARIGIDCVIHKHHLMCSTVPECPCGGFKAATMSQLRHQHLKPGRTGAHGRSIEFLERCRRCKEDVVDEELWKRHEASECQFKTQSRDDRIEARWARLYLAIYPNEVRIPNPRKCFEATATQYASTDIKLVVGEDVWLDQIQSDQYRRAFLAILPPARHTSDSFLGYQQPPSSTSDALEAGGNAFGHEPSNFMPSESALEALVEEQFGPDAIMDILLTDSMNPHSLIQDDSPLTPSFHDTSSFISTYKDILDRSLRHLSGLLQEGINLLHHEDKISLADKVDQQLLSFVARLREGGRSQYSSIPAEAVPTSRPLGERNGLLPPSVGTSGNMSWPSTLPSTGNYSSEQALDETSTQTGYTSIFSIVDRTKPDTQ
jgi:hypothetical protein